MLLQTTDDNYRKRRAAMPPDILWEHPDYAWVLIQHWERQQEAARYRLAREVRARAWRQRTPPRRIVGPVRWGWLQRLRGYQIQYRLWHLLRSTGALDILHTLVSMRIRRIRVVDRRNRYGTSDIASHSH
jgi:hypothetical protein